MRTAERVVALQALLARVQRNHRERRAELGLPALEARPVTVAPPPSPPVAPRRVVPPPPPSADDWTSLLADELAPPRGAGEVRVESAPRDEPARRAQATPGPDPFAGTELAFDAAVAPGDPQAVDARDEAPAAPQGEPAPEGPRSRGASGGAPASDRAPESELERAVRRAAEGRGHELELLAGAAYELRERRSTVPPREEEAEAEAPALHPPPPRASSDGSPAAEGAARAAETPAPRAVEAASPASRPARSGRRRAKSPVAPPPIEIVAQAPRPPRRLGAYVGGALGLVALFLGGRWLLGGEGRPQHGGADDPGATSGAPVAPSAARTAPPPRSSVDAPRASTSAKDPRPAPPPIARPKEMGLLWVDVDEPSDVYVQGLKVGPSARWLEVPCGMKNVRVARSAPPPPGHSFPLWLGEAKTVLVPCGAENHVKLSIE